MKKTALKIIYIAAAIYITIIIGGLASYLFGLGFSEKEVSLSKYMRDYVLFTSHFIVVFTVIVALVASCGFLFERWYKHFFKD